MNFISKSALRATTSAACLTFAALSSFAVATPALAQDAEDACDPELDEDCPEVTNADGTEATGNTVVITGSRIARPNLESTNPIATVTGQDLTERGTPNIGDALAELPALGSTFTQANSTRFIGTAGINRLDLRNLGTSRTLVLVNGRRHVTSSPGTYDVDTNTIPNELLESVDVVTGGNSAVYGSDAIAGVVNFKLRRDFDGIRLRGQSGISDEGDAATYSGSFTIGKNLFENRINVAFAAEYDHSDQLLMNQRDDFTGALTGFPGFTTTEPVSTYNPLTRTTTATPNRNDNGVPNTTLVDGLRFAQLNGNGMLQTTCTFLTNAQYDALSPAARARHDNRLINSCAGTALDSSGRRVPTSFSPTGGALQHYWSFNDAGTELVRSVPTADLRPLGGGVIGGLGSTGLEEAQLRPELDRYAFNFLLSGDFSAAFQPFLEAKYVRIDSKQTSTQPTFATGGTLSNTFRLDNAFLTPKARQQIIAINGLDPNSAAVLNGSQTFQSSRFNYDLGTRSEDHQRETYRIVAGVGGQLSDTGDLRYEVALNYGRTETYYETGGNVNIGNYNRAIDAVRLANGDIVCRVNADTSTTNDDPNCVALNVFGFGTASQAAKDYVLATSSREQWAEQYNATAFISGNTEAFLNLPGGPVGFAFGAEYRREDAFSGFDEFTRSGQSFLNAIGAFDPPAQEIKELFGELYLPLLADVPFVNELTIEGAARVSDYSTAEDPVYAYNAGLIYSPTPGLRLRASYARAVRAPNIGDLFSTQSETFLNGLVDPCSQQAIIDSGNPNRAARCAEAGIPTTIVVNGETRPWVNTSQSGISGFNQGNPDLLPETSDSWTFGGVFEPTFLRGLSFSVDYYDIKVSNVISGIGSQGVINRCYDDPVSLDNPFCAAVFRRRTSDPLTDFSFDGQTSRTYAGLNPITIPKLGPSFIDQPFNYAKLKARGIDFELAYIGNIADGVRLNTRLLATRNLERTDFTFIAAPEQSTRQHGVLGLPEFAVSAFTNIDFGEFDLSYNARFLSAMAVNSWETQFTHQGRGPTNPDATPFAKYPEVLYHNLRFGFEPEGTDFRFYAGVDNVLDQMPFLPLDGRGAGSGIYPITGRYFYAGARIAF